MNTQPSLLEARVRCKDALALNERRLIEAFDVEDIKRTNEAITKLASVLGAAWDKLPELQTGLAKAREELAYSARSIGDKFDGFADFKTQLFTAAGAEVSKRLANAFSLVTAMLGGLKSFGDIAQTMNVTVRTKDGDRKISVSELGEDFLKLPLAELGAAVQQKIGDKGKAFVNTTNAASMFVQALRPKGIVSLLKRFIGQGGIPYIDERKLAEQLMGLSYSELVAASNNAKRIDPPVESGDVMAVLKPAKKAQQRTAQARTEKVPTKSSGKSKAQKKPTEKPSDDIVKRIESAIAGMTYDQRQAILGALVRAGKDDKQRQAKKPKA